MDNEHKTKFKKGAASFYIVAFSTLILIVLAMSFTAIIISEVTRTSNDDLAQSAYDSALAGIEDAKLAYYNYQSCLESKATFDSSYIVAMDDSSVTCKDIVAWVEHPREDIDNMKECDMVGHILGRISKKSSGEVHLKETTKNDETAMRQAYTCAKIDINTFDYRATLAGDNSTRVVPIKLSSLEAKDINSIKVSWYSNSDGSDHQFTHWTKKGKVTFPTLATKAATPPTISFGIVQTAELFSLDEFDQTTPGATNRGTVYLVPTDILDYAKRSDTPDNYIGAYNDNDSKNIITAAQVVKSNDRTVKNLPYAVYCERIGDFACSATIQLPNVIQHNDSQYRNNETFMVVISIPYGQPSTDISLEFCTDEGGCESKTITTINEEGTEETTTKNNIAELRNMQVSIDSTGRANDLYRRVEARIDTADTYFPYPLYALELLGTKKAEPNLEKNLTVTCEYQSWGDFDPTCP